MAEVRLPQFSFYFQRNPATDTIDMIVITTSQVWKLNPNGEPIPGPDGNPIVEHVVPGDAYILPFSREAFEKLGNLHARERLAVDTISPDGRPFPPAGIVPT